MQPANHSWADSAYSPGEIDDARKRYLGSAIEHFISYLNGRLMHLQPDQSAYRIIFSGFDLMPRAAVVSEFVMVFPEQRLEGGRSAFSIFPRPGGDLFDPKGRVYRLALIFM